MRPCATWCWWSAPTKRITATSITAMPTSLADCRWCRSRPARPIPSCSRPGSRRPDAQKRRRRCARLRRAPSLPRSRRPAMPAATIHLVESDAALRAALAFSLGLQGFAVETYDSGAALLARIPLAPRGCLVIDWNLADGDGLALLAALRARGVSLPSILTASNPGRALRARAAAAGAAIVEKPLIGEDLTAAIGCALGAVVEAFYAKVRDDALIGPVFNGAIHDWPAHLETLKAFWSSVMLTSGRYKGRPLPAHAKHADAIGPASFERWLKLWAETTYDLLDPAAAAALQEK